MTLVRRQERRDTAANWTAINPVLASGELGVETDTLKVKVGDGVTVWVTLPYLVGGGGSVADATSTVKGVVRLAGDLGGTAAAPTVPALATLPGTYVPITHATTAAELSAAITAAQTAGGGEVRVAVVIALGSTSITVPDGVDLRCVGKGALTYSGAGVAVTFDNQNRGNSSINITRTAAAWDTGVDTTSVGVRLLNCGDSIYTIERIEYFETGLELRGFATTASDAGTQSNTIHLGRITNNKRQLRFSTGTSSTGIGYANANAFFGGHLRIDSGYASYVGTRYIDLGIGNGNTFVGVNMEGTLVEKVVHATSVENVWVGCRTEGNQAGSWHFTSTAFRNFVIACPGILGPNDAKFLDETVPKQNVIIGGRGMAVAADASNAAFEGRALFSNSDVIVQARNLAGALTAKLLGGGQFESYAGGEVHPRVKTDTAAGPGGYGGARFGRGNVAPDAFIGRSGGNTPSLQVDAPFGFKAYATAGRPAANAFTAGHGYYDTTLGKPAWTDGTAWRDAAGTVV